MNGLKFIRTRCNYSQKALAEAMGVSRQAVNMWETGKKSLPDERRDELCRIFGLDDAELLGEITNEDMDKIYSMPLFRSHLGQSERFAFKSVRDDSRKFTRGNRVAIYQEDASLDEMCAGKRNELKEIFSGIEQLSALDEVKNSLNNYIALNRMIRIFGGMLDLCEEAHKKYPEMVMIYFRMIFAVIDSLSISFGIADLESALGQYVDEKGIWDFSEFTVAATELFTEYITKYCMESCSKNNYNRTPDDHWRRDKYKTKGNS